MSFKTIKKLSNDLNFAKVYKQLLAQQETSEPLLVGSPVASIESGEQKGLTHVTIVSPLSQAGQSLVYGVVPGLVT